VTREKPAATNFFLSFADLKDQWIKKYLSTSSETYFSRGWHFASSMDGGGDQTTEGSSPEASDVAVVGVSGVDGQLPLDSQGNVVGVPGAI